jgi:hypothetical protein
MADFQKTFGDEDTEWLLAILHRELLVQQDEMVTFRNFIGKEFFFQLTLVIKQASVYTIVNVGSYKITFGVP